MDNNKFIKRKLALNQTSLAKKRLDLVTRELNKTDLLLDENKNNLEKLVRHLKEIATEYNTIGFNLLIKKSEEERLDRSIAFNKNNLIELGADILNQKLELVSIKNNIDEQIEENRLKIGEVLKDLNIKNDKTKESFNELNNKLNLSEVELSVKKLELNNLESKLRNLENEILMKESELDKADLELEELKGYMNSEVRRLGEWAVNLADREKLLNLHEKRLNNYARELKL